MKSLLNISSKKIGIILGAFIVTSVAIGAILYMNNPKIKFIHLINKEYKSFVSILDQANNSQLATLSENNTITSTGDVSFILTLNEEMFGDSLNGLSSVISGLNINYEYASDPATKNTYVKLNSSVEEKPLIDMELYQMDDKKYIYLNDIYDKYIESASTTAIENYGQQVEDITYLTDIIKRSLISAIDTSDFKASTQEIRIEDKNITVNKITLTLTDKRLKEIVKVLLTDIKNDDKCVKILNSLGSGDDSKKALEETIASIEDDVLLTDTVTINIYEKDDAIVKLDVFTGETKDFEYLNYVDFYPITKITIFDNNKVLADAIFEQKSLSDIAYTITINDDLIILDGSISKIEKTSDLNKTWDLDFKLDLSLTYDSSFLGSLTIDTKTITKIGEKVVMPEITDSVLQEDLTDAEQSVITDKIISKIFESFSITLPESQPEVSTNDVF